MIDCCRFRVCCGRPPSMCSLVFRVWLKLKTADHRPFQLTAIPEAQCTVEGHARGHRIIFNRVICYGMPSYGIIPGDSLCMWSSLTERGFKTIYHCTSSPRVQHNESRKFVNFTCGPRIVPRPRLRSCRGLASKALPDVCS